MLMQLQGSENSVLNNLNVAPIVNDVISNLGGVAKRQIDIPVVSVFSHYSFWADMLT